MAARIAVVLVLAAVAGEARAQVCAPQGPAATTCRLTLSQSRAYTLEARAHLDAGRGPASATLQVEVDGRTCATRRVGRGRGRLVLPAVCRVQLAPLGHTLSAQVDARGATATGVELSLVPDDRLATLPRERRELTESAPAVR